MVWRRMQAGAGAPGDMLRRAQAELNSACFVGRMPLVVAGMQWAVAWPLDSGRAGRE